MSYNGSGTFNINTAGQPVVTGTTITSTAFNLLTADLATGLTTALTKDGQSTPTANIPMGTFKITGLGAGTAATDAAQLGQLQAGATQIATVTGTDTFVGTLSPALGAYGTGNLFSFVAPNTNTGASTINLNSLGAKNITKLGSTALAAGDIVSGRIYLIEYDGTRFQLINPSASSVSSFSAGTTGFTPSTATTGAVTLAGTLATTNGGTGLTSFTSGGVVYASSTSALATGSALQFDGTSLGVNCTPSSFTNFTYLSINGTTGSILSLRSNNTTQFEINTTGSLNNFNSVTTLPFVWSINSAEQMRLTSTGLGIGTTSPSERLHIYGANPYFLLQGSEASAQTLYIRESAGGLYFGQYGVATRMLLDSSGNLGLGVTPSAWGANNRVLQGPVGGSCNFNSAAAETALVSNAYFNGSSWIYSSSTYASRYAVSGYNGTHSWYNAPSGTAGNAITFTQAMTLDANGNLLVGKTTTADTTVGFSVIGSGGTQPGAITSTLSGSTNSNTTMQVYSTGAGAYRFYVDMGGTVHATSIVITAISDQRLKENVRDIDTGLSTIMALKPRRFDWKEGKGQDKKNAAGFIAQEFEEVFPECVSTSKAGADGIEYKNINHETLIPTLVKAIQEQQTLIESLTTRLTALEGKA